MAGAGVVALPLVPVPDIDDNGEEDDKVVEDGLFWVDDEEEDKEFDEGIDITEGGIDPSATAPIPTVLAESLNDLQP